MGKIFVSVDGCHKFQLVVIKQNCSEIAIFRAIDFSLLESWRLLTFVLLQVHKKWLIKCLIAAAAAKSLQSCLTLCNPLDSSPPGSPVPEILQARTLEWVAISISNEWKWKVKVKPLSRVQFLATPWTAAYQAFPFMGFSRQEKWSGLPLPSLKCLIRKAKNNNICNYSIECS